RDVVSGSHIDRSVTNDRDYPRQGLRCEWIVAFGLAPDAGKRVVQHLFCELATTDYALGDAEQQGRTEFVQSLESLSRSFISRCSPQQEPPDFLLVEHATP